jgi:hypothetical protein
VERYYPASRYGSEEGGLSDEVLAAARESAKRARMDASTSQFEHKNANPENATTQDPSKVFDTVRPVNVAQDSNAGLIINNDLQVSSALKNFQRVPRAAPTRDDERILRATVQFPRPPGNLQLQ